MKRFTCAALALLLCLSTLLGGAALAAGHRIEKRELTAYIGSMESSIDMPFYFMDGVGDLPWVELNDWCEFMNLLVPSLTGDKKYELTLVPEGDTITLLRESDYDMTFDFARNTISFTDYNEFIHDSTGSSLLDVLTATGYNDAGEAELFKRDLRSSFDRAGDTVTLNLSDYDIHLIHQDGKGYVPFQTLGDFIIGPQLYMNTFYNGKAAFIATAEDFGDAEDGYTPLGEYYYSATPKKRTRALAEYGYNELCLALDKLYGLKESHGIDSFDRLFWQIAYDETLKGADPVEADAALYDFIDYYLDDLHSGFTGYSWMAGAYDTEGSYGTSSVRYDELALRYERARNAAMGKNPDEYMEVGNTAYITFDSFEMDEDDGKRYYAALDGAMLPNDTIGLIIYAHDQICREDSPIENVVFDLTCNDGGAVDAAIFVMSWVLGDAPFCVADTFTGALSTVIYRADVNLDRAFDSEDEADDKRLFCLISPVSFSCGNLVPAAFKASHRVTLLGQTSGGGSCTVQPMSTAWGSMFQISGASRMSFLKNGSFYDIDQGIEPDVYIADIAHLYDREALTEYINGLF